MTSETLYTLSRWFVALAFCSAITLLVWALWLRGSPDEKARAVERSKHGDRFTNSIGMELVYLDPPTMAPTGFTVGVSKRTARYEQFYRHVTLTQPYWIATTETTRGQFRQFVTETGYKRPSEDYPPPHEWHSPGIPQTDDHPVVYVNWGAAVAFCDWLSKREGREYRLPTAAEWEFACRAGTTTPYSFGPTISSGQANIDGSATMPVKSFPPNAWGLYDMHGNVSEWCADVFGEFDGVTDVVDPKGLAEGNMHVVRGGSWNLGAFFCGSSRHDAQYTDVSDASLGFRIAATSDRP